MAQVRRAAVAGTWYPGTSWALADAVDRHLARATREIAGELTAIIAPHAGLLYSGPVAAHAYRLLRGSRFDVAVLVGPSHFVAFDGVGVSRASGFDTPFGVVPVAADVVEALMQATPIVREHAAAHAREHSIEMQLPFLQRVVPSTPIVPLVMGHQTRATAVALSEALVSVLHGRDALLIASTDLSHYHDSTTAAHLDGIVIDHVSRFDAEGLQCALDRQPDHACGGGPVVAVMRAAHALGARDAIVLDYADSGDVSGDNARVVGYMSAALGNFHS